RREETSETREHVAFHTLVLSRVRRSVNNPIPWRGAGGRISSSIPAISPRASSSLSEYHVPDKITREQDAMNAERADDASNPNVEEVVAEATRDIADVAAI